MYTASENEEVQRGRACASHLADADFCLSGPIPEDMVDYTVAHKTTSLGMHIFPAANTMFIIVDWTWRVQDSATRCWCGWLDVARAVGNATMTSQ